MSVYDLDIKGLRKAFLRFNKTLYGRTIFFLAYIIPAILFIGGCVVLVAGLIKSCQSMLLTSAAIFVAFVVTFIIGNIYFYSEIRRFCKEEDKKKK